MLWGEMYERRTMYVLHNLCGATQYACKFYSGGNFAATAEFSLFTRLCTWMVQTKLFPRRRHRGMRNTECGMMTDFKWTFFLFPIKEGVKKPSFFTPSCIGDRKKCFRTDKGHCKSFYERICRLPEGVRGYVERWRLFVAKRLKNIEKSNKMRFFNKINTLLLLQTA